MIPIIVVVSISLLLPLPMPASVRSDIAASANTTVKGPPSGPFGLWESAIAEREQKKALQNGRGWAFVGTFEEEELGRAET